MKYEVEALADITGGYGDRIFNSKKGEKIELSADGVEIVLSGGFKDVFGDSFKIVRQIAETPEEQEAFDLAAREEKEREKLSGTPKEKLVKQAEKQGIEGASGLNKTPLVEAILDVKFPAGEQGITDPETIGVGTTGTATVTPQTAMARTSASPATTGTTSTGAGARTPSGTTISRSKGVKRSLK
ncbi:MAG: hypothetical protein M3367_02975 [Acidobacteriota bacterium]|nr:hypothetical protein [Acidobacteriota bacterium]